MQYRQDGGGGGGGGQWEGAEGVMGLNSNYTGPGRNKGAQMKLRGPVGRNCTKMNADYLLLE